MSKLISGIVATATSAVLTVAGVNFVHNEKLEETNMNYCVIRSDVPPNVQSAVDWSVMIANDDSYGYDPDRTREHDLDCSELIIEAFKQAGFNVGEATYTGNMKRVFEANGFEVLDYYAGMPLQIGDVFLNETYHTEMLVGYYDDGIGKNVGAHDDFNGVSGDSDVDYDGVGDEIDFGEYTEYTSVHPWEYILRYKAHFYDWLQIPDYENDFYAFIESDNTVLASYNDVLFMETETGNPEEVWHFVKEDNNRFTISNGSYSGSYNLYKDDTGAIILHEVGSESSCLTSVAGTVINTEYDCSEEQRFRIRHVSDPIYVTYDFDGKECPIREEHYNSAYSSAFDLVITGFKGWSTTPNGEIIDTSRVLIPHDHTLYAVIDESVKPTVEEETPNHNSGRGKHDNEPTTESKTDEVAYDEDIVIPQDHSIYNPNIVTPDPVQYTPEPETEKTAIQAESINLNRYSKTLNTVGNSTSFTLIAEVSPSSAQNKNIHYESSNSSVCRVEGNTGRIYAVSDGKCTIKAIADNGVSASCEVTVSTKYTTKAETVPVTTYKNVPESYDMECYCGRTIEGMVRQFYDHDISNQYDTLGLSRAYGQWHHQWTFTAAEVDAAARISPGQQQGGSQNGTNASSATGYSMLYGDTYYIFFIKNVNYKTVETVSYQTNTISIPVEYN